jgi:hypothetical protein
LAFGPVPVAIIRPIIKKTFPADSVTRIEMYLSAFGVESDDFLSIDVYSNFANDSSYCHKSYYNPANKDSVYTLSKDELKTIKELLNIAALGKLKPEYTVDKTDQPCSTTEIFTTRQAFTIKDYGLVGDPPLQELYEIVYKF